ncbi:hypothetical protein MPTK1_4g02810 [Marchantia polymorpha subsp. ruderalis]|uniref:Uncharacterized protein n=2 Tax=Marchantia polymorpha TaxID=3197 RepID=A0A176VGE8_MARPO|nr:hypothetical protein AXG93_1520s1130 [Marchantia polymorpha subsp. ruderalis]PTQ34394.1 hypothetical protein MARPO_0080s0018 [Marchantia polymorpha]BBN07310.1 hypothetical protein Mp_4g02810 [Marchantia polymorpha subsp. ruderalis]|eukprot:PTQ34394.1 hypothetical protein MARPO_0080s0018 [Marchantia polymorpha]
MALARSIREGVEKNMQKLRIKKKSAGVRQREIGADFGGGERRGGSSSSSSISISSISSSSSDSGAVVALGCTRRSRSRNSSISSSSISSGGAHGKSPSSSSAGSSSFVDAAPRAKRLVSPQGRKKAMGWMRKIAGPFRRAWDIVSCRHIHQSHKRSRGMGRLYNDVRSCGYDDVHLMWSMLQTSTAETPKWRRLSRRHSRAQR